MEHPSALRRGLLVLFVAFLVLGSGPTLVAAQPVAGGLGFTGAAGTVVIDEGQTVNQVTGMAGSVLVRGTVNGDVSALAGDVVIAETGVVNGDVSVATGSLTIAGTVNGQVSAGTGNAVLTPTGRVTGDYTVGAGNVLIAGAIGGNAAVGAEVIDLRETAVIAGDLRYDGRLTQHPGSAVQGAVILDTNLGTGVGPVRWSMPAWRTPFWLDTAYGFFANLVLGAILLLVFPDFSRRVATRVAEQPARSGAIGFLVLVGVPIALVLIAITLIGIPIAIMGAFVFAVAVWMGLVYGEYAVGHWVLSRSSEMVNRWYALLVGLLVFSLLGLVPVVGGIAAFIAVLLGLGALGSSLRGTYRERRGKDASPTEATTGADRDASAA